MLKRKQAATGPIRLTAGDRVFYAANTVLLALLALVLAVNLIQLVLMGFFRKEDA